MRILLTAILFTASCFGGEYEDLVRTTKTWQHRLGMDSWKISVVPATMGMILDVNDDKPVFAFSSFDVEAKVGVVMIMRRADYTPQMKSVAKITTMRQVRADQRNSVLHELLHVLVAHADEEWAVSRLALLLKP